MSESDSGSETRARLVEQVAKLRQFGEDCQRGYPPNVAEQIWDIADAMSALLAAPEDARQANRLALAEVQIRDADEELAAFGFQASGDDHATRVDKALQTIVALRREIDRLRGVMTAVVSWLAPGPCGAHQCDGCLCDMQLAHDALNDALTPEDQP